ncbi:MAG: T9SS type A sorting domain-containing protein [Candidatus Kapaibacterium sp.]
MKIFFPLLIALAGIILTANTAQAQWKQTNGPYGAIVTCLVHNGSNVYAGTSDSGVYISSNNGVTWRNTNTGLAVGAINAIAISDSTIYVGTNGQNGGDGGRIVVSPDNGKTWKAPIKLSQLKRVFSIVVQGANVFAATSDQILLSKDKGMTWDWAGSGLTNLYSTQLTVSDTSLFAFNSNTGAFVSSNSGKSWAPAMNGLTDKNFYSCAASGNAIIVGTQSGVFLSTDRGVSCTKISTSILTFPPSVLALKDSTILVGGSSASLLRSDNLGASWTDIGRTLPDTNGIRSIAIHPSISGDIIVGTNLGVYHSTDNGLTWKKSTSGIYGHRIAALTADNTGLYAGTDNQSAGGSVYHSSDNGQTWTSFGSGLPLRQVTSLLKSGNTIIAGSKEEGSLYVATDSDTTWTENYFPSLGITSLIKTDDGSIFACTNRYGIYRSTDNGKTWLKRNDGIEGTYIQSIAASGSTIITLAGVGGSNVLKMYLSANKGDSWELLGTDSFPTYYMANNALFMSDSIIYTESRVYVLTSTGSVKQVTPKYNIGSGSYCFAKSGEKLFAGSSSGIYLSVNQGARWSKVNTGFPETIVVTSLTILGEYLYAGTNSGVWKRPLAELVPSGVEESVVSADGIVISPNPASGSVTLAGIEGVVTIRLLNSIGMEVKQIPASNTPVHIDMSDVASGIYRIEIRTASGIITKPILVLR